MEIPPMCSVSFDCNTIIFPGKEKAIYLRLQSKATTFSFYGQKGLVCIIARGVKALNAIKRKPNIGADIVNIILYYYVLLFHVRKYFTRRAQDQYKIKELDLFYLFWQLTFSAHCSCHSVVPPVPEKLYLEVDTYLG